MDQHARRDRINRTHNVRYWPTLGNRAPYQENRPQHAWPEKRPSEKTEGAAEAEGESDSLYASAIVSHHPELEDESIIAWGLSMSAKGEPQEGVVDFCEVKGDNVQWLPDLSEEELDSMAQLSTEDQSDERIFRVFFLNTLGSTRSWLPGNFSIRPQIWKALLKAGLSKIMLVDIFTVEGVFAKMGEQCFQRRDENGLLSSFEVCYHAHLGWDIGTCYIQSNRSGNHTTYFCINYPSRAQDRFRSFIKADHSNAYRDFYLDVLAADEACRQLRFTIGQRRKRLLEYEARYEDDGSVVSIQQLHRLARDWNTLNQDCLDHMSTLEFLDRSYGKFFKSVNGTDGGWLVDRRTDMHETFGVLKAQNGNLVRWTAVYRERTNIRINLLFHLANQREAKISAQIAGSTAEVAKQTQRDSASMITMAAVTMLFLPGTFISTILSSTFFEYGDANLAVSRGWWVLPASTIPTTIGVFVVWLAWRRWRLRKQVEEQEAATGRR